MRMRTWRAMCAAAVVSAIAIPAFAQQEGAIEDIRENSSNQPNQPANQPNQPGARENVPQPGQADRTPQGRERTRGVRGRMRGAQVSDQELAAWVLADIESEVRISEAVAERTENEKVKQFAQMSAKQHGSHAERLRQIAAMSRGGAARGGTSPRPRTEAGPPETRRGVPDSTRETPTDSRREASNGAATESTPGGEAGIQTEPGADATQPGSTRTTRKPAAGAMASSSGAIALKQQVEQNRAKAVTQAFQDTQGNELDQWYLGEQVLAHMGMQATIEVALQNAQSPQLKQTLTACQQACQKHVQTARQLMNEVNRSQQNPQSQRN